MPKVSVTLLLTVCFISLAKGNSLTPPWLNKEYKFVCSEICSEYLKGETLKCMVASPFGLAGGELVLRTLPNLDWRYYEINGHEYDLPKEYCKSIMAADHFYYGGNKSLCHVASYPKHGLYYDDLRDSTRQDNIKAPQRYNDGRTDALCVWAARDMCLRQHMVSCMKDVCCWKTVEPKLCGEWATSDEDINRYRTHMYNIVQTMKRY